MRSKQVHRRGVRAGPALSLVVRAGAGVNTIDVAGGLAARRLRRELPGPELDRGRRARHRARRRARPAHPGQRRPPARRQVGQEDVLRGARPLRAHARRRGRGLHRPRGRPARAGARDARPRLVALARRRAREGARRRARAGSRRARARVGLPLPAPAALEGDARRRLARRARGDEARRRPREHRARRDRRPGRAPRARARGPDPRRHGRVRRASRRRAGPTSTARSRSCPTSTGRTTSAPRPSRRRTRSPARRCGSSRRSCAPARCRTASTWRRKTPASARIVVRHLDKVGVLANVLGAIREAGINVEEVRNTIFEQAQAASCTIDLDERPPEALLEHAPHPRSPTSSSSGRSTCSDVTGCRTSRPSRAPRRRPRPTPAWRGATRRRPPSAPPRPRAARRRCESG